MAIKLISTNSLEQYNQANKKKSLADYAIILLSYIIIGFMIALFSAELFK